MQIIVLKGKSNTGKTTTLNLVYDIILQGGATPIGNKQTLGNPKQNDFEIIVEWKSKKIGFFTMGDYSTYLANAIYRYEKLDCDILICAISTNTPKVKANEALNAPRFNTIVIDKQVSKDKKVQTSLNQSDADKIIESL